MALSLLLYTIAGEKMPWLILHIALPLILLSSKFVGKLMDRLVRGTGLLGGGRVSIPHLGYLVIFLALAALSARVACQASYTHRELPVEMLVYSQGSQGIREVTQEIDVLAQSTEGELPITVDATLFSGWPWPWYLRHYGVDYPRLTDISTPPRGSVLILAAQNEERAAPFLTGYVEQRRIPILMWSPERYKRLDLSDLRGLDGWGSAWRYFWKREGSGASVGRDVIIYFPKGNAPDR